MEQERAREKMNEEEEVDDEKYGDDDFEEGVEEDIEEGVDTNKENKPVVVEENESKEDRAGSALVGDIMSTFSPSLASFEYAVAKALGTKGEEEVRFFLLICSLLPPLFTN